MSTAPSDAISDGESFRVGSLELFFDLVFVFAITQLTGVLAGEMATRGVGHLALGLAQVLLAFGLLWWIYAGYAWLTNTFQPRSFLGRMLLLTGMAGFLIIALATPYAFSHGAIAWGLGYLVVVLVHGGLYTQVNPHILRVMPANVGAALLVVGAGLVHHGPLAYLLWALALMLPLVWPYVVPPGAFFRLRPAHIVERHSLLVLITFGESVVAIGIGATGPRLPVGTAVAAVLGLALVAALWWSYFSSDDVRVEETLTAASSGERTTMVMYGYFYAHLPIIIGVITMAAGLKQAIAHPGRALPTNAAIALAAGIALYLLGDVWFRRIMRIGPSPLRLVAALACLAAIPLGSWYAEAELVALLLIVATALALEESRLPSSR